MNRYNDGMMASHLVLSLLFAAAASRTYVLETGLYDKITLDNGEVWLCVNPAGGIAEVAPCKVEVRKLQLDDGPATKVSVANKEPLFLLKGAASVKPGRVTSLYARGDDSPAVIEATLHDKKYVIRTVEGERADGSPVQRLRLELGKRQMILGECAGRDDLFPVWAGDLDGDGRLDVYINITHHNGWTEEILFLSSADATGKALTARAAKLTIQKRE